LQERALVSHRAASDLKAAIALGHVTRLFQLMHLLAQPMRLGGFSLCLIDELLNGVGNPTPARSLSPLFAQYSRCVRSLRT
jgi:hypothetical protein